MPRMPAIKSELVHDLASRLRYVPPDAARRQLFACEKLVDRLAEDLHAPSGVSPIERWFPWDWVLGEITGFARGLSVEGGGGAQAAASPDAQVIEGRALLADLCALCEYLSVAARCSIEVFQSSEWLSINDLCVRWGVSRRTIERWRVTGLRARRVTAPTDPAPRPRGHNATRSGTAMLERVVFARAHVEVFSQRRGLVPASEPADALTPFPDRSRAQAMLAPRKPKPRSKELTDERLLALARRFVRWHTRSSVAAKQSTTSFGSASRQRAGVQAFARALAPRVGVSAATIRRRVRAVERRLPEPIFASASPARRTGTDGLEPAPARAPRSRATRARSHWRERFERLALSFERWRADHQPAIEAPTFGRPDASDVLLATPGAMGVMNDPTDRRSSSGANRLRASGRVVPTASASINPDSQGPSRVCDLDVDWPHSVREFIAAAEHTPAPDAEHELQAAAAYHFLLFDAERRLRQRPAKQLAQSVELIECRLLWASRLKARLLRAQLGAILRSIETGLAESDATGAESDRAATSTGPRSLGRTVVTPAPRKLSELADAQAVDLIRAALDAASHAFERYDPFKGGRLAAPISLAVARAVSRWNRTHGRRAGRLPSHASATGSAARPTAGDDRAAAPSAAISDLAAKRRNLHPWQSFLEPDPAVRDCVRSWPPQEPRSRALLMRWGWASNTPTTPEAQRSRTPSTPPTPAAEVARRLAIPVTRVRADERQVQRQARLNRLD